MHLGQRQGAITVLILLKKKMSSNPLTHLLPVDTASRGAKIGISSSLRRDLGNAGNLTLLSLGHAYKISQLSLSSGDSFRASWFRAQIQGTAFLAFCTFNFVFRKHKWLTSRNEKIQILSTSPGCVKCPL